MLAQPPEKVFSTDIIWSEIQLPKGRYQFLCGSSHEFGNSFSFVSLFLSILHFTMVKRSMGKVVLCLGLSSVFQKMLVDVGIDIDGSGISLLNFVILNVLSELGMRL